MHHRGIEFEVIEVSRSKWRWTIYPKSKRSDARTVTREVTGRDRQEVVAQCKREIDRKLERQ